YRRQTTTSLRGAMDAVCGSDLQCPVRGDRRRKESVRACGGGDRGLATTGCDRRVRRGVLPPRACGAAAHLIGLRSATISGPVLFRLAFHRWQKSVVSYRGFALLVAVQMSALGQKQTYAPHNGMSALPPIATTKADIGKPSSLHYPQKRTCAVH